MKIVYRYEVKKTSTYEREFNEVEIEEFLKYYNEIYDESLTKEHLFENIYDYEGYFQEYIVSEGMDEYNQLYLKDEDEIDYDWWVNLKKE